MFPSIRGKVEIKKECLQEPFQHDVLNHIAKYLHKEDALSWMKTSREFYWNIGPLVNALPKKNILDYLNKDVIRHIAEFIDYDPLVNFRIVCKEIHAAVKDVKKIRPDVQVSSMISNVFALNYNTWFTEMGTGGKVWG